MTKFLLGLIGVMITLGLSILVMIFGWGLEVKSWGWVIWGYLGAAFIGALFQLSRD